MKNIKFFSLAALLMAGAAFTACSNDNDVADEKQQTVKEGKYTLTIQAGKNITRALAVGDSNGDEFDDIIATWTAGDEVKVYLSGDGTYVGYLTAQNAGDVTTLSGDLGGVGASDELTLKFKTPDNYATQEGSLLWIADNCDYATATVVVDHISGTTLVPKSSETTFVNQQAIVKFVLEDSGGNALPINHMNISTDYDGNYEGPKAERVDLPYNIDSNEIFVALPNADLITSIYLTEAMDHSKTYTYERETQYFEKGYLKNGDFKTITVRMSPQN